MDILIIIAIILAVIAIAGIFIPRFPAVVTGLLGLLCMHFAGAPFCDSKTIIFWSAASTIVLMLGILQPKALTAMRQGHSYIAAGAFIGALLGFIAANVVAAIIFGSALGAFLGAVAYNRTPKGPHIPFSSRQFIQYLCAKGLPAVVSCSMATIVFATAL